MPLFPLFSLCLKSLTKPKPRPSRILAIGIAEHQGTSPRRTAHEPGPSPMPSLSKKPRAASALARFISSLRTDRRSGATGSLPVETGFPTSLADLYVKNQSRLKKPSKKVKKKRDVATNSESVLTTVGSATDVSDSATLPVLISSGNVEQVVTEEERVPSVPGDDVLVCPRKNSVGIGSVVIVNILVLLLLAFFGTKLILGSTALAFFAWFLDSVRLDLGQCFKARPEVRTNLGLEQRSLALVSPIREVEIQTESDSTEAEIRAESNQSRKIDEIWEESPDFCEVQTPNLKKKSILKKLLPKKRFKRKPEEKDGVLEDSVRSREMEAASISEKVEEGIVNLATKENQEEQSTREFQIIGGEISQSCEIKEKVSWFVVFPMLILFGLMEGKAIALVVTIFCFTSVCLIEFARRNQSKERTRLTL